jgi:hypothetical protein
MLCPPALLPPRAALIDRTSCREPSSPPYEPPPLPARQQRLLRSVCRYVERESPLFIATLLPRRAAREE